MNIKGAIFDMDGTILDTERIYDEATQKLINEYGNGKELEWDIKKNTIGIPGKVVSKLFVDTYEIKLTPEEFKKKRDELLVEPLKSCQFMKGAKETIHKCKHELGLKTGIATSSIKSNFDNKTSNLKDWLNANIDIIITGDDERLKEGKPHPDIFILASNELGLKPEECIMFEDALSGTIAAIKSGAKIVVAIPDPRHRQDIEKITYDKNKTKLIILKSLDEFNFILINSSKI
jgi:pseudouridine-5'-monophosphatase